MPAPSAHDISIVLVGAATTTRLTLARDAEGLSEFENVTGPPLNPIIESRGELDYRTLDPKRGITWDLSDFSHGLGPFEYKPGYYFYSINIDSRWRGMVISGPDDAADLTGIAANEKVIKRIRVGADNWIITSTTVYRSVGGTAIWTQVGALGIGWTAGNPTDIVVFGASGTNPVIAVAMGSSTAYQTTIDNGANWVASTKTANGGNAKFANFFAVATRGGSGPKVWYVRNQNELYSTFDLTNGDPTGTTSSTIGDILNDDFTSIIEDQNGVLLVGTIHALYTVDSAGIVTRLTPFYQHKADSDAGAPTGSPTRPTNRNFENPVEVEGRIYYPVEDYRIGEWNPDGNPHHWIDGIQPSSVGAAPILRLPVTCLTAVGNELFAFLGSTATIIDRTNLPGSTYLAGNGPGGQTGNLFIGKRQPGESWEWHGALFALGVPVRYMFYDDTTNYLYIAFAAQRTVNNSMNRIYIPLSSPLEKTSSLYPTSSCTLETGLYSASQPLVRKTMRYGSSIIRVAILSDIVLQLRTAADDAATDYVTLSQYLTSAAALTGTAFAAATTFRGARAKFLLTPGASTNAVILYAAQLIHQTYPPLYADLSLSIRLRSGKLNRSGTMQGITMEQARLLLVNWKAETEPATVTDLLTNEVWSCNLLPGSGIKGIGRNRRLTLYLAEVR